jgi:tetratricopeptide (TPR) repeat protein
LRKEPGLPGPPPLPDDPAARAAQLTSQGRKAFADRAYGLAAQRFRRAAVADKKSARARFLLAQALFALGKYREAVAAVHEGMDLAPEWPRAPFRPRLELYAGSEAAFTAQLKDLQDALTGSPDNRFFLFLYAYELWFDGRQAEAVPLFQKARAVTVDTTYIDRFLRAARGKAVAAR